MPTDAAALAAALRDLLAEGAPIWIPADAETNRAALASLLDAFEAAERAEQSPALRELAAEVAEWRELAAIMLPLRIAQLEGVEQRKNGNGVLSSSPRATRGRELRAARNAETINRLRALLAKAGGGAAAEEAASE